MGKTLAGLSDRIARREVGILANNTRAMFFGGDRGSPLVYSVSLHGHRIADIGEGGVSLFSAGWRTPTTKDRLNRILDAVGAPCGVYQRNHEWFLWNRVTDSDQPFVEGMSVPCGV